MDHLLPSDNLVRAPDLIATDMDGETVMMDVESGIYFGLSGVGGRIWELLEDPRSAEDLTRAIMAEFDVDPETCRTDVQSFLDSLLENGLVKRA
jgi:hypothetical protein